MAVEKGRGCGYRKVGGLYLVGEGLSVACDRLPYPVGVCPTCGEGIKPSRGIRWMDGKKFFGGNCKNLIREQNNNNPLSGSMGCHSLHCPICFSDELERVGLMWVGERYYPRPEDFECESANMGVCKRISAVPKEIELDKTWILLVHPKAIVGKVEEKVVEGMGRVETRIFKPGIFHAFKPRRIEKIVTDQTSDEELEKLKKRGITPVVVPHDDPDHNPKAKKAKKEEPLLVEG